MKKKWWIILIIVTILIWIWVAYFICIRQTWKIETKSECQDFINECCKKEWSFRAWGWYAVYDTSRGRTNIDDKCDEVCPKDCSRYTEEHWYFNDEEKQQEYYDKKIEECNKKYEECIKKEYGNLGGILKCHKCDKYWQPRYQWN